MIIKRVGKTLRLLRTIEDKPDESPEFVPFNLNLSTKDVKAILDEIHDKMLEMFDGKTIKQINVLDFSRVALRIIVKTLNRKME